MYDKVWSTLSIYPGFSLILLFSDDDSVLQSFLRGIKDCGMELVSVGSTTEAGEELRSDGAMYSWEFQVPTV